LSDISDRQRQILDLITTTVQRRGYPPSVREIGEAVGLSSPSTVHSHLSALVDGGYLRRDPSKPRAIEVVDAGDGTTCANGSRCPSSVAFAGSPILAEEEIEEIFPPTELVGNDPCSCRSRALDAQRRDRRRSAGPPSDARNGGSPRPDRRRRGHGQGLRKEAGPWLLPSNFP
jgi:hypothetical protein